MNKNVTAIILIVLGIGIYFTFTQGKIAEIHDVSVVNQQYQTAIDDSVKLVSIRDKVLDEYNSISETDRDRLNKLVPDTVDNVRLIIDVKDDIAARHGLALKSIKTDSPDKQAAAGDTTGNDQYGVVKLSFTVTTTYENFLNFLKDLEASLRIMDVSSLTVAAADKGNYDFTVELKTYWLKQQ